MIMSGDGSPNQSVLRSPPPQPVNRPAVAANIRAASGGGERASLDGWQVVRHDSESDSGETKDVALSSSDLVSWGPCRRQLTNRKPAIAVNVHLALAV